MSWRCTWCTPVPNTHFLTDWLARPLLRNLSFEANPTLVSKQTSEVNFQKLAWLGRGMDQSSSFGQRGGGTMVLPSPRSLCSSKCFRCRKWQCSILNAQQQNLFLYVLRCWIVDALSKVTGDFSNDSCKTTRCERARPGGFQIIPKVWKPLKANPGELPDGHQRTSLPLASTRTAPLSCSQSCWRDAWGLFLLWKGYWWFAWGWWLSAGIGSQWWLLDEHCIMRQYCKSHILNRKG